MRRCSIIRYKAIPSGDNYGEKALSFQALNKAADRLLARRKSTALPSVWRKTGLPKANSEILHPNWDKE